MLGFILPSPEACRVGVESQSVDGVVGIQALGSVGALCCGK